ncbi:T9SS type A sorting domain-containing protein [Draconibacterium sp. IB214405]|uniref:T9SS type A sorting domain-containing protein n=1 Tax=Draconibacterium sp. IB214405 TaxID=3097352 RepID=UPI002A0C6F16|nr:T9SS type A sorting domain-containing protein [Draconibacterium sp. IB214405]MDX8338652.1 T9SS type A sorting domain-containing protein [Draconibacterium sp. IB214405]
MKQLLLLFTLLGLLLSVSGQNLENAEWRTYIDGISIHDITNAGDYLWLIDGSATRLIKFDKESGNFETFSIRDVNSSSNDYFLTVACDNNGTPWIGTFTGSYKLINGNNWKVINLEPVGKISGTQRGVMWIGYQYDLRRYEGDSIKVFDAFEYRGINSITTDPDGDLWFISSSFSGIFSKVCELINENGNWSMNEWFADSMSTLGSIGVISLRNLSIDTGNTKWMSGLATYNHEEATYESQLISYNDSGWNLYQLPSPSYIHTVAAEEEKVWCGTDKGLMCLHDSIWSVYNTGNSPLPSDKVYKILIDSDGTKWIGTGKGLVTLKEGVSAIETANNLENQISIYPNPARDFIQLDVSLLLGENQISICDLNGRTLKQTTSAQSHTTLNLTQLTSGIYLLKIESGKEVFTQKFVKQ